MVEAVIMNNRGMITIPANIRKKHNFKEGSQFMVLELDDRLTVIPIQTAAELRTDLIPREVLEKSLDEDRRIELELEGRSP